MSDNFDSKNKPSNAKVANSDDNTGSPSASHAAPIYSVTSYAQTHQPPPLPRRSLLRQRSRRKPALVRQRNGEWLWVILTAAMMTAFAAVILAAMVLTRLPLSAQEIIPTADVFAALPTPVDARTEFSPDGRRIGVDVLPLEDGSLIELRPWDGQSRFTIIVAGLDRRLNETGLEFRTDTMMLISLDPQTKRMGILSIPRDLYVQIPGWQEYRINAALYLGEARGEGYGPTLLQQTVQLNFGMPVHNYLLVDFQAFIDIIDLIGGVEVSIDYTINDARYPDMNFGYDPFYLPAGTHQLNGYDALRFARTRHGNNDIRRAERQQQVLFAVRGRVLSLDMIPQLLIQAPAIWHTLSNNVHTGLSLEHLIQLALYIKDIDRDNITTGIINFQYLQEHTTENGQHVLVPLRAPLGRLLRQVFGEDYWK